MAQENMRELALDIVINVMEKGEYSHILLRRVLDKYAYLPRTEKAFLSRLALGTIERAVELDYILNAFSRTPVKKMKPLIRNLLRISLYQIRYMDSVPDAAACNEAVKLAKKRGFSSLAGFVNAVLRNAAGGYTRIAFPEYVQYSMPEGLYEMIREQYPREYRDILEGFLSHETRGVCVRVNRSRMSFAEEESCMAALSAKPLSGEAGCYRLMRPEGLEDLEPFREGKIVVQDMGAALAAYLAAPKAGDRCLDLCAAPGGKTVHLLDLMQDQGTVVSRDISEAKLPFIGETVRRCGFSSVRIEQADAAVYRQADEAAYDIVIADVPCSGLGVIGNKPDIKYRVNPDGLQELIRLQRSVLKNAVRYVKPGGVLLFCTCTINRQENEENVRWLLREEPCALCDFEQRLPERFRRLATQNGMLTLLPGQADTEGFFLAKLVRTAADNRRA